MGLYVLIRYLFSISVIGLYVLICYLFSILLICYLYSLIHKKGSPFNTVFITNLQAELFQQHIIRNSM